MGINLAKLKAKMEKLKGNRGPSDLWKPKPEGEESRIRFVLSPDNEDPFKELHFHYKIGARRSILCPRRNWGRVCPICEWAKSIANGETGVSDVAERKELTKPLWPRQRFFAAVVDRSDETLTPKVYGFGVKVYTELVEKLFNEEYKDYMDPERGIDVTVSTEKSAGAMYPSTKLTFSRKDSVLCDSKEKLQEIFSSIPDVEEMYKPLTTAEIKDCLNEWLAEQDSDPDQTSGEVMRGGSGAVESTSSEKKAEVKQSGVDSVDDDFEKALQEISGEASA